MSEQPAPPDPQNVPAAPEGLRPEAEAQVFAFLIEHSFWGMRWGIEEGPDGLPKIKEGSSDVVIKSDDWTRALHHLARLAINATAQQFTDALADLAVYREVYGPPPRARRPAMPSAEDQAGFQRVLDVVQEKLLAHTPWRAENAALHELLTVLMKTYTHAPTPDVAWWTREAILTVARGWFPSEQANDALHALLATGPAAMVRRQAFASLYGRAPFVSEERAELRGPLYEAQFVPERPEGEGTARPVPEQDRERKSWPGLYPDGPHPDVPPC